jgi:hypothetical protein
VTPELLEQLIATFAEQLAPRVAAELAGVQAAPTEAWRTIGLAELAERFGRSERWCRERTKDKEDPLPRLVLDGGSLRFDVDDVRAWARRRRVPAQEDDARGPLAGAPRLRLAGEEPL